jgi:hypothetical protein
MTATTPALIAAAAGVGFGHAILPDHWVPLAVMGRTRRYPLARVARLSGLASVAHVLVSIALGPVIIAVGLQFRSTIQGAQDTIIGAILILTALGFATLELSGHGRHHEHEHVRTRLHPHPREHTHPYEHTHQASHAKPGSQAANTERRFHRFGLVIPFGAAASPDLTILPVFLAAAAAGAATAIAALVVFAAATIGTIVALTVTVCLGGYQIRGQWLERRGNALTALVLLIIGALVLAGIV